MIIGSSRDVSSPFDSRTKVAPASDSRLDSGNGFRCGGFAISGAQVSERWRTDGGHLNSAAR